MSAGARLPLAVADRLVLALVERWGGPASGLEVVGSVRRRKPDVGDLEFIAPMPESHGRAAVDRLHHAVSGTLRDARWSLIAAAAAIGEPLEGFKPHFRHASLGIDAVARLLGEPVGECGYYCDEGSGHVDHHRAVVKVEIYRYDAGEQGNYGWIKAMRTGPAELGPRLLGAYKQRRGGSGPASDKGYLRDEIGRPVPTPDEASVFRLAGMAYTPPEKRG